MWPGFGTSQCFFVVPAAGIAAEPGTIVGAGVITGAAAVGATIAEVG